jgi:hypothetical protein
MRSRIIQRLAQSIASEPAQSGLLLGFAKSALAESDKVKVPPGFTGPDYATLLLHVAAEVEHALLVEYLFAAYSLGGPQVPKSYRERVQDWQTVVLGIAKEEMAHFVSVQNVLRLIGAPLNLERDDFPWDLPFAPYQFSLQRLTPATLARFVYIESPENWPKDAEGDREKIAELASEGQARPVNQVGKLYRTLIALLSDEDLIPDSAFHDGTVPFQASWDEWGRGYRDGARGAVSSNDGVPDLLIEKVYSRDSAVAALKAIAEQGEAPDLDADMGEESHFRRFYEIWKDFPQDGEWSPVRAVADNPTTVDGLIGAQYIDAEQARLWATLLNLRYRILLTYLAHSFDLSGTPHQPAAEARGFVLNGAFGEMYSLRVISNLLVGMLLGEGSGEFAGPPFEMPYSLDLPDDDADRWQLHVELLTAADTLAAGLRPGANAEEQAYLDTLAALDGRKRATIEAIVRGAEARRIRLGGWA